MDWTGWTYLNRTWSGPGWIGQFSEWAGLQGLLKNQMGFISSPKIPTFIALEALQGDK